MAAETILVVDEDPALRQQVALALKDAGFVVEQAEDRAQAREKVAQKRYSLVIGHETQSVHSRRSLLKQLHALKPDLPVIVLSEQATLEQAVEAMRSGAADFLPHPVDTRKLLSRLKVLLTRLGRDEHDLVAEDPRSQELLRLVRRVALTDVTVMITGPSGSGKEVIARYIHQYSPRSRAPYVAVNCAAIPENMLEAILFGHEKGAFTGAIDTRPGKFEQAQGGTLLLDEISEMPLGLQAKLLRVLQEREVERIGGKESIALNVRVLATTNRNLKREVQQGRFREDLYYRLNVFPIHVPPLAARPGDILPLAQSFIRRQAGNVYLSPEAKKRLLQHHWPGNVRELENVIQRAMILKTGGIIQAMDLHFETLQEPTPPSAPTVVAEGAQGGGRLSSDLKMQEYRMIQQTLQATGGNRKQAAETLGISPRTLRYKLARMRELGLNIPG